MRKLWICLGLALLSVAGPATGADALKGWEPDHLRAIERHLARGALRGSDNELDDRLAEQLAHGESPQLVGDVEGVEINDLAAEAGNRLRGG